jgi:hypothetical protein
MDYFEFPINWRLARRPSPLRIDFTESRFAGILPTGDVVVIPRDPSRDVLVLRNWLHNDDNNTEGYLMYGRYRIDSKGRMILTDLKFYFRQPVDAMYFRLRWGGKSPPS